MKYLIKIILILSIFNLVSCFQDNDKEEKEEDLCKSVSCESYETCTRGVCIILPDRCKTNTDCELTELCNSANYCVLKNCEENSTDEQACGFNGNGIQQLKCVNNVWENDGDCVDSDVCVNNTTEVVKCGYSDLGEFQRECQNGRWSMGDLCSFNIVDESSDINDTLTDFTVKNGITYYVKTVVVNPGRTENKDIIIYKADSNGVNNVSISSIADDYDGKIFVDDEGNIYIAGTSTGSFGEYANNGNADIFIAKFNADLEQQWIILYGNSGVDFATDILVFDSKIYVSGNIDGEMNVDGIIIKYDLNGYYIREQHSDNFEYEDVISAIDIDNEGNLYSTGESIISAEESKIVVTKYNVFFEKQWSKEYGDSGINSAKDIKFFAGNLYLTGNTTSINFLENTNQGLNDAFIMIVDNVDNVWGKLIGSENDDYANKLFINTYGDIYIYGTTNGSIYQNASMGGNDVFFAKYDFDLNLNNKFQFGSVDFNGKNNDLNGGFVWLDNSLYLSGITNSYFITENTTNDTNMFFAKYDEDISCVQGEERFVICETDNTLIQKIACDENVWRYVTECIPVPCNPDYAKVTKCGLNNRGYQSYICENDMWIIEGQCNDSDICTDGETRDEVCGLNGIQSYICNYGQFEPNGSCSQDIKQFGDASSDIYDVKHRRANNFNYILAYSYGDFNGIPNSGNGNNTSDVLVIKTDDSGIIITSKLIGSNDYDNPYDMAIDDNGNVYVIGSTEGQLPLATSLQGEDAFIIKYDSNLVIQWVKQFGTNVNDNGKAIVIKDGYIYLTGTTEGWMAQGQGAVQDIFIMKLDLEGNQLSVKQIGSNYNDFPNAMIEHNNYLYITGESNGRFESPTNSLANSGFIIKIDLNFQTPEFTQFQASNNIISRDIDVDSLGNIFITGTTTGTWQGISTSSGNDLFVAKFNNNLTYVTHFVSGEFTADGAYSLVIDENDNIHVLGMLSNFNTGNYDAWYLKRDNNLNSTDQFFIIPIGNTTTEYAKDINIFDNKIYILGSTKGTFDSNDTNTKGKLFLFSKDL